MNQRDVISHLGRTMADARSVEGVFRSLAAAETFIARVRHLRTVVESANDAEPSLAAIAKGVFPSVQGESLRTTFSTFRAQLARVSAATNRDFRLIQPRMRSRGPDEIRCRFEGEPLADVGVPKLDTSAITAPLEAAGVLAELYAAPDEPRMFVSFAVADKDLADDFVRELRENLPLRCRYPVRLWRFDELREESGLTPGEENEAGIRTALGRCPFGLLLVSPSLLGSDFIRRVELPHFLGAARKAYGIPVALRDFLPGRDRHPLLDPVFVYTLEGKPYNHVRDDPLKRAEFIKGLAEHIQAIIERQRRPPEKGAGERGERVLAEAGAAGAVRLDAREFRRVFQDRFAAETAGAWTDVLVDSRAEHEAHLGRMMPEKEPAPEPIGVPLIAELLTWVRDPKACAWMALLGETGAGKTMACMELTRQLLASVKSGPLPVYLDLRRVNEDGLLGRSPRPELPEILTALLRRSSGSSDVSPEDVLRIVRERGAILIWDGVDEVLVHLTADEGRAFFRQLLEALPPGLAGRKDAGRLLFACRTQYFRNLAEEASVLTGGQREGIDAFAAVDRTETRRPPSRARFEVLRILPFNESQIREYLRANVPGLDVERAMEVVRGVHNLRDLASRPYCLSLIRAALPQLDQALREGRRVRSVDLYDRLIEQWLARDTGKHKLLKHHKLDLMSRLAVEMWREGARSLTADRLEAWLERQIVSEPVWMAAYGARFASEARDSLLEDFRTATFLARWDGEAFRFAHASLLEFFLARRLMEALETGAASEWALPMPSRETFDFLAEFRARRATESVAAARRMDESLCTMLAEAQPLRSRAALAFWLRLQARGDAAPLPRRLDLHGLDLEGWVFEAGPKGRLVLPEADFSGAVLLRARFQDAEMPGAVFRQADLRSAEFQCCGLAGAHFDGAEMEGALFRLCGLEQSTCTDTKAAGLCLIRCFWENDASGEGVWEALVPPEHRTTGAGRRTHAPSLAAFVGIGHAWSWGASSCAFSGDGRWIVSGGDYGTVRVWEAETGRLVRTIVGHEEWVWSCAWSGDGRWIVSGSSDGMGLWAAQTGKLVRRIAVCKGEVMSCAFSGDSRWIVSGSSDGAVGVWEAETGRLVRRLEGHEGLVMACAWSGDGRRIVGGSSDGTAVVWEAATGRLVRRLEGHKGWVTSCAFSGDGRWIASGGKDGTVGVWEAETGRLVRRLETHKGEVMSCVFSRDGRWIASGGSGERLVVWEAETGRLVRRLEGYEGWVSSCSFSGDGRRIVSVGNEGTVRVWEADTGRLVRRLEGHKGGVMSWAFSGDGRWIASGSPDGTVGLWEAQTGRLVRRFDGHDWSVFSCAFSRDGRQIVSGSGDGTVRVWEMETGKLVRRLEGYEGPVWSCAFSGDARRIATKGPEGTVRVWEAETGRETAATDGDRDLLRAGPETVPTGVTLRISPWRTMLLTDSSGQLLREIAPLNDGEWAVLEPAKPGDTDSPAQRIALASQGAWRWLGYAADVTDADGRTRRVVYPAEILGPLPTVE